MRTSNHGKMADILISYLTVNMNENGGREHLGL